MVDQGAVNEIDLASQVKQPLVDIEKRHMTSGAAVQPHGRKSCFIHWGPS